MRLLIPEPSGLSARATHKIMARGISAFALLLLLQAASSITEQMKWTVRWWELIFLWLFLTLLAAFMAASIRGRKLLPIAGVLAGLVFLGLLTWPLAVAPSYPPSAGTPWMWAMINVGSAWCAFAAGTAAGCVYSVLISFVFAVVRTLPAGGSASVAVALEDVLFATVLALIICLSIGVLREAAAKVDAAAESAVSNYREAATANAMSQERLRLDGLLHDSVMTALLVAANSGSPEERSASSDLARTARERLTLQSAGDALPANAATANEIAARIRFAVDDGVESPEVIVQPEGSDRVLFPGNVVSAFVEATREAVYNTVRHSRASRCEVTVTGRTTVGRARLLVRIKDNGEGFDPTLVSDRRLGIKISIKARMTAVGGSAEVHTSPGCGTDVTLQWEGDPA